MEILVNGVNLYYEVVGNGIPLIMVHGNGDDHTIFDNAVEVLKEKFTCYLIDSRGHGKSSKVDAFDYKTMATDVLAFVDSIGLMQPVYFGFSDGAVIGLLAAIEQPKKFRKIIISGANVDPKGVKLWMRLYLKITSLFDHDPLLKLMLKEPHISNSELSKIESPTLVLAGSKDLILESHTRGIADAIPHSELQILEGENHDSYVVGSDKVAKWIISFCKE